jgi:hypothetical protein
MPGARAPCGSQLRARSTVSNRIDLPRCGPSRHIVVSDRSGAQLPNHGAPTPLAPALRRSARRSAPRPSGGEGELEGGGAAKRSSPLERDKRGGPDSNLRRGAIRAGKARKRLYGGARTVTGRARSRPFRTSRSANSKWQLRALQERSPPHMNAITYSTSYGNARRCDASLGG